MFQSLQSSAHVTKGLSTVQLHLLNMDTGFLMLETIRNLYKVHVRKLELLLLLKGNVTR